MTKDQGRKETDKLLEEMEKKIRKEYRQAEKEIQQKLNDHLNRFKVKDLQKQEALKNGLITQKEYNDWRMGQMAIGSRWNSMKDTISSDLHNANNIAKSIVNGYMPQVYALNHNYGTYEVEHKGKVDTSYTLYDKQTVERLMRDNPDMLPPPGKKTSERIAAGKEKRWNNQHIQSVMTQSILQGESIPKIASRLAKKVGDSNEAAAIRNARTMTTRAENYGRLDSYKRAQKMGIDLQKQWISTLDHRTRDSHVDLDGEVQPIDKPFSNGLDCPGGMGPPEEVYNCFVGDTYAVSDSEIIRSYKHAYSGELVRIKTRAGVSFVCTPNHPIFAASGWTAAKDLREGDCILLAEIGAASKMERIHQLTKNMGAEVDNIGLVDFHGDEASNVEIATFKDKLDDIAEDVDYISMFLDIPTFNDRIISKKVYKGECDVFNIQTLKGFYFVNASETSDFTAIVKNCRCTMVAQLKGFETDASDMSLRRNEKLGDMSYDEWKAYHKENQNNKAKSNAPSTGNYTKVTNKQEANDALSRLFGSVEPKFLKNNEKLVVENTNQILELNSKYGAISEGNQGYITSSPSGRAVAWTSGTYKKDNNRTNLSLVGKYYKDPDALKELELKCRDSQWSMPFSDDKWNVYTVTHEYGHILESHIARKREDWDALAEQVKNYNPALQLKEYRKAEQKQEKLIYNEIIEIAKNNNPDFDLRSQLSRYGQSKYCEAFAEIFANSQCGKPNELGNAMLQWLKKEGY